MQDNAVTVQGVLTAAVGKVIPGVSNVNGCSRTDAGVHARGYVCNFHCNTSIPSQNLPNALNSKLPSDIRVLSAEFVDEDFNARFSAISKTYKYLIYKDEVLDPFWRNYVYHTNWEIDIEKMVQASENMVGEHDFSAFMATGGTQTTTVRRVNYINVTKRDKIIEIEINANAYLYNMVRIIAGTLFYCGCGKIKPSEIEGIILSGDRVKAGITLPPQGLFLEKVYYQ
jgi:tRNA pseudouridine38-40 synthase